jgi:hypothetical protein
MNNYIITDIPFTTDRDKHLCINICKLTGKFFNNGGSILSVVSEQIQEKEKISIRVSHTLTYAYCYEKKDFPEFKRIYYRDFLKQYKVTTKQLLGLNE